MLDSQAFTVRKAAVLGAGVMGAQIAAHFINAGIQVVLFDLPADGKDTNANIKLALKQLTKLKPAPLAQNDKASLIQVANYNDNLQQLKDCDFIIEVIAERMDLKEQLFKKIIPFINQNAILASNTSGLSINHLAEILPSELQPRFFGVHFFNPPRYMQLLEMIPSQFSDNALFDKLETFFTSNLGKNVVRAKDTPNFIANRIGVFSMLVTLYHAESFNIPFDIVDALTGPLVGRPKSATMRTADVVGLDVFGHTITTMAEGLPNNPWREYFKMPKWLQEIIATGNLGQKTNKGIYQKQGKEIHVYDLDLKDYRLADKKPDAEVLAILKQKDPVAKFKQLQESNHEQAKFLWACFRDVFHYCAVNAPEIANSVRDLDQAIRFGFGWQQGPFETWQSAGWEAVAGLINDDINNQKTIASEPLPKWVKQISGPYEKTLAYEFSSESMVNRSDLQVYKKQLYPAPMLTERFDEGTNIFETDAVRLWTLNNNDVAILSFKSKMCAIGTEVLEGINQAVETAEKSAKALVIWQRHSPHFSVGANLKEFVQVMQYRDFSSLDNTLNNFQQACLRLRYSSIPTVAAVNGFVFGGGCEVMLHCDKTVATLESYIGLVEAGVGLLPAGGGCKEMTQRASTAHLSKDPFDHLETYFTQIAMATASTSGRDAQSLGYLRDFDTVVMHPNELLSVALSQANALAEANYVMPFKQPIKVSGKNGIARIQTLLVNMKAGEMISEHDYLIATKMAEVLCGGPVDSNSYVPEEWLLKLEREAFIELAATEKTLARIEHTLATGKPLRN